MIHQISWDTILKRNIDNDKDTRVYILIGRKCVSSEVVYWMREDRGVTVENIPPGVLAK